MGGFECSSHRDSRGRRLDLIASTRHDEFADADYSRLLDLNIKTCRDGLRWHMIEPQPFRYDFSSLRQQIDAVKRTGIEVVWDLFHYGYPDDLDILNDHFLERFASYSRAATEFLKTEIGGPLFVCPVNEISFFSWIAGQVGTFYPCEKRRGRRHETPTRKIHARVDRCHSLSGAGCANCHDGPGDPCCPAA